MSIVALLCLLFGIAALVLLALLLLQRRTLMALQQVSQQVQRTAIGGSLRSRIELQTDQPELAALITAVNHLLSRAAAAVERAPSAAASLAALGDRVHEAVLIHAGTIRYANGQFAQLAGCRAEELIGRRLAEVVPQEYSDLVADHIRRRLAGESSTERYEIDLVSPTGGNARLELSSWPIEYDGERALLILGVEVLPTQTVSELTLSEDRGRARLTLESLYEALITTDIQGRVEYLNPAAERLLGLSSADAAGKPLQEVARVAEESDHTVLIEPVRQALSAGTPLSLGRRAVLLGAAKQGEHLVELSAAPIRLPTGETLGVVVLLHDVTEIRGLARQMSYQAAHDGLTGLINRREFERRLQASLEIARRGENSHVLCYLDLDRFKVINDTSGHMAGDAMLRETAKILRAAVRDSDTVARLGGDEFGMLLVGCPLEKAQQIAADVCRAVQDFRFVWKDKIFDVGVSIGLVEIARDSSSMEEALAAADSACYVAKRQGGHVAVYSARDEAFARQSGEIQWLQTLQGALRESRFELYCQPIVPSYAANDEGPAMEVLIRLRDDAGEQLPPIDFVRAAERYRLMGLVDRWVVQTTLTALGRGAIQLPPKRSVAINISAQTLADGEFLEFVVDCFDSTGSIPAQVCFEIAESAVVANLEQARRFVGVLHGMGCRFALDNFGSGLGSFANLRNIAIDYLKIDGSFFKNLARDSVNQAMLTAMIRLARTLNFKVIAERVEDAGALDAARRMGVDYLQGFAIGRPEKMAMAA
ncbi:MAG TPA: EAL domain-containing protein [Steroidobacteraceae bacterium]|jgi:diguanylate cyclase (GGDEF)-like protein/PAS domain S-box-containing protein|nr:EAL domain-containing protein [Steroidobacteraceae bacterium]